LRRPQLDGRIFDVQRVYGRLLLNSMKLTRANVGDYAALLASFRPLYLKGLASALYHLATLLTASKAAIPPLRAVFSSGENLTPEMRTAIERAFQCPLLDCYGHMERTACIAQCLEGSYHVLSDYGLLELVDRKPSEESGVELASALGTSLYNRAMPLLRYEIGDLIEVFLNPPRCRCGRSFPVVRGVRGRIAAAIVTPEGRVESALFALPSIVPGIAFLQFVQQCPDRVEVRVVRAEAFDGDCDSILRRCLREALGLSVEVRIHYVSLEEIDTDPSGKRPVAISEVPRVAAGNQIG
jgi:phenylacetate-CoA ligase